MTKERTLAQAQVVANHSGRTMAVLNLNPFGGLYVIRDWDDRFAGSRELVKRVDPRPPCGVANLTSDAQRKAG
jgi:hypothetical protein